MVVEVTGVEPPPPGRANRLRAHDFSSYLASRRWGALGATPTMPPLFLRHARHGRPGRSLPPGYALIIAAPTLT